MPRRPRSKVNRDPETGITNRQGGMCRKAYSLYKDYNADVVVIIRRPDGRTGGFQSRPGLLRELVSSPEDCLLGPGEVKAHIGNLGQPKSIQISSTPSISSLSNYSSSTSSEYSDSTIPQSDSPDFLSGTHHPWDDFLNESREYEGAMVFPSSSTPRIAQYKLPCPTQSATIEQPKPVSFCKKKALLSLLESYL